MEGKFGKIGSGKAASSLSISRSEPKQIAHNDNAGARTRSHEESVLLRYILSSPSSFDENVTPRTRPTTIGRTQIHQKWSNTIDGGCGSNRGSSGGRIGFSNRGTPLASLDNMDMSPLVKSPLASAAAAGAISLEEDVLVMDAISVANCSGGSQFKLSSSLGSDAGGSSPYLLRYGGCVPKREAGRSWQETGPGCSGAKCSRHYGEDESRSPLPCKTKLPESSSSKEGLNSQGQRTTQLSTKTAISTIMKEEPLRGSPLALSRFNSGLTRDGLKQSKEDRVSAIEQVNKVWSPTDDGIEVELPFPAKNPPSREEVDEYINRFLYGLFSNEKWKRLPVFAEICPHNPESAPSN